jgi:hypothetical protein
MRGIGLRVVEWSPILLTTCAQRRSVLSGDRMAFGFGYAASLGARRALPSLNAATVDV